MKSEGRDNPPDLVQIETKKHASKAMWVDHVPIIIKKTVESNTENQYGSILTVHCFTDT